MEYVPELKQEYVFDGESLRFTDGVSYTPAEAVLISKGRCTGDDIRAIHAVKRAFNGQIIALNDMTLAVSDKTIEDYRAVASRSRRNAAYNGSELPEKYDLSELRLRFDPFAGGRYGPKKR